MRYVHFEKIGFIISPSEERFIVPTHETVGGWMRPLGDKPVSAGFVRLRDGKLECYGESLSLGLKSDPGDSEALAAQLGI